MALLSKKMQASLNEQLNAEMYSAYLYLSMCAYFEHANLSGFANWMRLQASEELAHAMKFYAYLNDRQSRVDLKAISAPPKAWKSPLQAFEAAYGHEQEISHRIDRLMEEAGAERDHATEIFLQWFVTEQVEELASTGLVIEKLKMVRGAPSGVFLLDRELANRAPEPEASEPE